MSGLAEKWSTQLAGQHGVEALPDWFVQLRRTAAEEFSRHGLPHRKVEDWKYTSLKLLEARGQQLAAAGRSDARIEEVEWPSPLCVGDRGAVRMLNGKLVQSPQELGDISVLSLRRALESEEADPWIRDRLESLAVNGPSRAFSALNSSMLGPGVVIRVPPGVSAGRLATLWAFDPAAPAALFNSRVLIRLEEGASLSLVEQFESEKAHAHALNVVYQVELGAGSRLDYARLQQECDEAALITRLECDLECDSSFSASGFDWGGALVRHDTLARLNGAGANADINGAFIVDGSQHYDHHVFVDHVAGDSRSGQFFRGVLGGRSRGVYNGKARIGKGADGASVRQNNANLLLSTMAEMDTKPELEIYADEVEASHGATVGQLDEDAIFYMRTRGLKDSEARAMLTGAFCRAVVDRLPGATAAVAEPLIARMDKALPSE